MILLKSHSCFDGYTEFFEHNSQCTKSKMRFAVHRPADKVSIRGGLIWLSGLHCTEENFIIKSGVQRALVNSGIVVICPDTSPRVSEYKGPTQNDRLGPGASLYVDATLPPFSQHFQMYTYIQSELYDILNSQYKLNSNISIFGHSMGGHGALILALKNPHLFRSVSALAPMIHPTQSDWARNAFRQYLGNNEGDWRKCDSIYLLEDGHLFPEEILIDQGTHDEYVTRRDRFDMFEKLAVSQGQKYTLNWRSPFDHSYFFVSTFIQSHIDFHKKFLVP